MTSETLRIRPFNDGDLQAATQVYNHYVAETTVTFQIAPLTTTDFRGQFCHGAEPHCLLGVATGGELIGFAGYCSYHPREAYARTASVFVYLDPKCTGSRLGGPVLAAVEDHAKAAGLHALIALICGENEPSLKHFSRNGYVECGRMRQVGRKFDRWLDVVYLQRLFD